MVGHGLEGGARSERERSEFRERGDGSFRGSWERGIGHRLRRPYWTMAQAHPLRHCSLEEALAPGAGAWRDRRAAVLSAPFR